MKKIRLGQTSLEVSTLCMGTVYFGSTMDDRTSFDYLDRFCALGGNFLDTARIYADWLSPDCLQASEQCLGRWLKARGMQEGIVIATKGGHPPFWVENARPALSAAELAREADDSRRNLGLDTLPLYYLHRDDPARPVEEIMDALFALQDRGVIRHAACSNWHAERIRAANAYAAACGREGFAAVSNRWSLARIAPVLGDPTLVKMDAELFRMHCDEALPLMPFTSMANGYLSKLAAGAPISAGLRSDYGLPENDSLARRTAELAARKGLTVAQVAQCFFYAQPFQVIPVMSFSRPAQLEEASAAADMALTPKECAFLLDGSAY